VSVKKQFSNDNAPPRPSLHRLRLCRGSTCHFVIVRHPIYPSLYLTLSINLGHIRPLAPSTPSIFFTSNSFMYKHGRYSTRGSILDGTGQNGTQSYVQGHMKPEELFRKLTSDKPMQWEAVFEAVIKQECGGFCVLDCKRCKAHVGPAKPSQAAQCHKCTAAALAAAGVRSIPRKHSPMGRKTP